MRWPRCPAYTLIGKPEAKGPLGDRPLGKGNNNRMDIGATELATGCCKRGHKPSISVK